MEIIYVIGGSNVIGLVQTGVPNPNITWETAKTGNVGLDATLWNGLLGVTFDYFQTRRSDILTTAASIVPGYTGLTLPDENTGDKTLLVVVSSHGIETLEKRSFLPQHYLVPILRSEVDKSKGSLTQNPGY